MKSAVDQLSSMLFTTVILAILMLWFTWGILLAESDVLRQGFWAMNSSLAPAWFSQPGRIPSVLKFWFAGLCLIMAVLGINLVFCSWTKILRIIRSRQAVSKIIMLIIHMVFGLVALGHFGSFVLGYRYEQVKLREAQSFPLPKGFGVTVTEIHFEDDLSSLRQRPRDRAPGTFHPEANFCEVAMTKDGTEVARGRAYFLKPFTSEGIQVTLKRFTPPKGMKSRKVRSGKPGVRLIITHNPLKTMVFVLFPVMISGIALYTVMTWRMRPNDKSN